MDYRISKELKSLGEQDGNEAWLPLPTGKADIERTVARIRGLKLLSFRTGEDGKDIVNHADLSFDSIEALSSFFNGGFNGEGGNGSTVFDIKARRIVMNFGEGMGENEAFLEALKGYDFSLSFTLPGAAAVRWLDADGDSTGPGVCTVSGKTVQFKAAMAELVFLPKASYLEISWQ